MTCSFAYQVDFQQACHDITAITFIQEAQRALQVVAKPHNILLKKMYII